MIGPLLLQLFLFIVIKKLKHILLNLAHCQVSVHSRYGLDVFMIFHFTLHHLLHDHQLKGLVVYDHYFEFVILITGAVTVRFFG